MKNVLGIVLACLSISVSMNGYAIDEACVQAKYQAYKTWFATEIRPKLQDCNKEETTAMANRCMNKWMDVNVQHFVESKNKLGVECKVEKNEQSNADQIFVKETN